MENKKLLLLSLSLLGICTTTSVGANQLDSLDNNKEMYSSITETKKPNNFNDNKEEAKNWAIKFFKSFNNFLSTSQKNSIKQIKQLEEAMLWRGSDLSKYDQTEPNYDFLKKNIENIKKALSANKGSLTESLVVYKSVAIEDYFKMPTSFFFNSDTEINKEHIEELQDQMYGGFLPALHSFELTNNGVSSTNDTNKIKLELTLPKGTNTGFIDSNNIFIQDSYAFETDQISVVTEKNEKYIKIQAQLVPREQVQKIVDTDEAAANIVLNDSLELPSETKLVDFHFEGLTATIGSKRALIAINDFLKNEKMSYDLKKKLIESMITNPKGGGLVFTDLFFSVLEQAQGIVGVPSDKELSGLTIIHPEYPSYSFIQSPGFAKNQADTYLARNSPAGYLAHELGHRFDAMCGDGIPYTFKYDLTFGPIFDFESVNAPWSARKSPAEFWAEIFRYKYSKDPLIAHLFDNEGYFIETKKIFKEELKDLGIEE